jgi:hypothetical protein
MPFTALLSMEDRMKKLRIALFAVVAIGLAVALSGCAFFFDSSDASVRIVNNSGYTVYYVYISPTSSGTWGSDWLGTTTTISDGSSYTVTGITPGTYDLQARGMLGSVIETAMGVVLEAGQSYAWTLPY